jgi:hypothetical protein
MRSAREGRREAFTRECAGGVLSAPRISSDADIFRSTEGNTARVDIAGPLLAAASSWTLARAEALSSGTGRSPSPSPPVVAGRLLGRPEAVTDHERKSGLPEVAFVCCGARGAKG